MNAPIVKHFMKEDEKKKSIGVKESQSLRALRLLAEEGTYAGMSKKHKGILEFTIPARNISIVSSALSLTAVIIAILVLFVDAVFVDFQNNTRNIVALYATYIIIGFVSFYYMQKFTKAIEDIKQEYGDLAVKSMALGDAVKSKKGTYKTPRQSVIISFAIVLTMVALSYYGATQIGDFAKEKLVNKVEIQQEVQKSIEYKEIQNKINANGQTSLGVLLSSGDKDKQLQMLKDAVAEAEAPIDSKVNGYLLLSILVEVVAILAPLFLWEILSAIPPKQRKTVARSIFDIDKKTLDINTKIKKELLNKDVEALTRKHKISLDDKQIDVSNTEEVLRSLYQNGAISPTARLKEGKRLVSARRLFSSSAKIERVTTRIIKPLVSAGAIKREGNFYYAVWTLDEVLKALQPKEVQS